MVLHLGCDEFVPLSSIVAVLDAARSPRLLKEVLPDNADGAQIRRIGTDEIKSVVIVSSGGRRVFFLSPIAAQTLRKRVQSGF